MHRFEIKSVLFCSSSTSMSLLSKTSSLLLQYNNNKSNTKDDNNKYCNTHVIELHIETHAISHDFNLATTNNSVSKI